MLSQVTHQGKEKNRGTKKWNYLHGTQKYKETSCLG
jgi:hypothetical protein